jgi:hypothetical protein
MELKPLDGKPRGIVALMNEIFQISIAYYKPLSIFHVKAEHQSDTKFLGLKTGCRV